jgi:hypothetical protein
MRNFSSAFLASAFSLDGREFAAFRADISGDAFKDQFVVTVSVSAHFVLRLFHSA